MLKDIMSRILANQSVIDKINISQTHEQIGSSVPFAAGLHTGEAAFIQVGDDCAAIPDGHGGYLLFAAEGIVSSFLEKSPWFAGYCAVMVNISDVCAMGGLPLAVTDVLWVKDSLDAQQIWEGMQAAATAYGVPIVGGHTCYRVENKNLAVSILGKAEKLLTSFDAAAGDTLMIAIDLNGTYFENYPFFNASTTSTTEHLRQISGLMAKLANNGWSVAAKDISMGGIIGTLAMLMHSSGVGSEIDLLSIPKPDGISWDKWLTSFPSFGYLFTCEREKIPEIRKLFDTASIHCEAIGKITDTHSITVKYNDSHFNINLNSYNYA